MAIIGKSGGGKSVLIKHLTGLMKPDSGRVLIDGVDITRLGMRELNEVRKSFGVLFQSGALFDYMTVYENISFPLRERLKLRESDIRPRVFEALRDVDLQGTEDKYPSELSGGMKKRAALARAIITNPSIVFFDEPTTGLDPILKHSIHTLIKDNHARYGFTGIIVSHEIPDIFYVASSIALLHDGVVALSGTSRDMVDSKIPEVRAFVHSNPNLVMT
ncbi:MAG: ATP-binding cassette domain-containing protein [Nitrospirae bacterium]|nr:ATP-binding cassette domain-containing protein [Nitrospirota bacterium]